MVSSSVWDVFFAALGAGVGALLLMMMIDYLPGLIFPSAGVEFS